MLATASLTGVVALTSDALIGLAAVASAALLVITFATWRRAAQPGARHVAARFGLLLASNLAVISLIFLAVNRSFDFYASWAELLGTSTSSGVVQAASPSASPGGGSGGGQPGTPGTPGPLQGGSQPAGPASAAGGSIRVLGTQSLTAGDGHQDAGELQTVRVYGVRSGLTARGYVYLPPQYPAAGQPAQSGHPFPVVVVISDAIAGNGTASTAAGRSPGPAGQLALTAYAQVAAGRAAPAVYVMLPATVAAGDQACLDVPGGPQAGMFFSEDLPAVVRTAYRVAGGPVGWGLLGDDSGGYCAVRLAMTSSDRFAVASAPAGSYEVPPGIDAAQGSAVTPRGGGAAPQPRRTPAPWLFGGSPLLQDEANMIWRLRQLPPPPVTVLFTGPDGADLGQSRAFISAVRPPMRAGTVTLAPASASTAPSQPLVPVIDRVSRKLSSWG